MANAFNPSIYAPSEPQRAAAAQRAQWAADLVKSIISGELAKQGTRLAPDVLIDVLRAVPDLAETGIVSFDPTWIASFLPAGQVTPQMWNAIQNYALTLGQMPGMEKAYTLLNRYQLPAGTPTWRRQSLEDAVNLAKTAILSGIQYNPLEKKWEPVKQRFVDWLQTGLERLANLYSTNVGLPQPGSANLLTPPQQLSTQSTTGSWIYPPMRFSLPETSPNQSSLQKLVQSKGQYLTSDPDDMLAQALTALTTEGVSSAIRAN